MSLRVRAKVLLHAWPYNFYDNVRVNNVCLIEIMFILSAIKSHFKGSYDKHNLTLVVVSYEIYETRQKAVIRFP